MSPGRSRAVLVALVAALVLAVAAPVAGLAQPAEVRGAASDLTLVTDATYTVKPEAGQVGVSVAIAARNRTSESRTRRFWFDHAFLAVQPGAAGIHISGPKGARVRVAKRTRDATLLRIDFGSRIYSGRGAAFHLTFNLPGRGKAASPQVRVGTSLVTIPVWAFASNGARGSSVTVRFPSGWDVDVESGSFDRRSTDDAGWTVLATGPIASPLTFFAYVSAQQPAVYTETPLRVAVGERWADLALRAWEDDHAWARKTGALFEKALPALARDIGLPWGLDEPLVVQEAVSREAGAYAGVYEPAAGRIEIAYWAAPGVVIHQAAHAWFNGMLLADRWANEGFATFYALRAAAGAEVAMDAPSMTDEARAAALPLNAWTGDEPAGSAADTYGYAASLELADAIAERVGPDVLARVWADAAGRVGAYQPPGLPGAAAVDSPTPEGVEAVPDWRGLLDLLEARSGQDLAPLWRDRVVTPAEAGLLDARTAARTSYGRTLAVAGDWQLPRAVRDALRAWQFDTAQRLMADARTVVAQRNAVVAMAKRDGVTLPGSMRGLFEAGTMTEASAQAEAERSALIAIERAAAARSADDDVLSRIGMLGEHPAVDLAEARLALAAGDIDASLAAADRAERAWTVAWQEGRRRALLALAVLATVVVLASAAVGSLRRSRRSRRGTMPAAAAVAPSASSSTADDGPASA